MQAKDHLGNVYPSLKAMLEHYGISEYEFFKRYNHMTLKDALTTYKYYDHKGNGFNSIREMCKYWKVDYNTFYSRYTRNWPMEKCLTRKSKK